MPLTSRVHIKRLSTDWLFVGLAFLARDGSATAVWRQSQHAEALN